MIPILIVSGLSCPAAGRSPTIGGGYPTRTTLGRRRRGSRRLPTPRRLAPALTRPVDHQRGGRTAVRPRGDDIRNGVHGGVARGDAIGNEGARESCPRWPPWMMRGRRGRGVISMVSVSSGRDRHLRLAIVSRGSKLLCFERAHYIVLGAYSETIALLEPVLSAISRMATSPVRPTCFSVRQSRARATSTRGLEMLDEPRREPRHAGVHPAIRAEIAHARAHRALDSARAGRNRASRAPRGRLPEPTSSPCARHSCAASLRLRRSDSRKRSRSSM